MQEGTIDLWTHAKTMADCGSSRMACGESNPNPRRVFRHRWEFSGNSFVPNL